MSDNEIIIKLWEHMELLFPLLNRIEKMLLQKDCPNKEVFNTKEAAVYMGCSIWSIYRWRRNSKLKTSRPTKGGLYIERIDCYSFMLLTGQISITGMTSEEEKMNILNPERD